jgi:hypothetical protein
VTDTQEAPEPDASGITGSPGEAEHGVTAMLRSDAMILLLARKSVEEGDGSPAAHIAARRDLDREIRELLPWPTGEDYARAAEDYERLGRSHDAALLRSMAATDTLIAAARAAWNTRYDARPFTPAAEMIDAMRQAGIIDFDPAGPYIGVDGAAYEPGAFTMSGKEMPILVVTGRGMAEFITDWPGFDEMADWVASRGTTVSGPLTPPPANRDCRAWQEDQVLARLVTSPRDASRLTVGLTPDTFTTDVRYDLYQAITALADRSGYYTPEQLETEVGIRMAAVPPYALVNYGGATGLFAHAYLARLASTQVSREAAAATASVLVQEDAHYRAGPARAAARAQAPAPAPGRDLHQKETLAAGPSLQQPRPQPGPAPDAAAVQHL